jgi:hypothetical protein
MVLLASASVACGALAVTALLAVIRDWRPRRQQAQAEAMDAMDRARWRASLRHLALQRIAAGQLPLPPELVEDLSSHALLENAIRLPDGVPLDERKDLPGV